MAKIEKIKCDNCDRVADSRTAGWLYIVGKGITINLKARRLYQSRKRVDFCSTDCLKMWLDEQIKELFADED